MQKITIEYRAEDFFDFVDDDVDKYDKAATLDAYERNAEDSLARASGIDAEVEFRRDGGLHTKAWIDGEEVENLSEHSIGLALDDAFTYEGTWVLRSELTVEEREQIVEAAKVAGVLFVEEFNEPLDPSRTDWDSTSWDYDLGKFPFKGVLRAVAPLYKEAWKLYQETLVETTHQRCKKGV